MVWRFHISLTEKEIGERNNSSKKLKTGVQELFGSIGRRRGSIHEGIRRIADHLRQVASRSDRVQAAKVAPACRDRNVSNA